MNDPTIAKFEWLGLFSDAVIPAKVNTALDAVCHLMEQKMQYGAGERDMILMQHVFEIRYSNAHRETVVSTLVESIPSPLRTTEHCNSSTGSDTVRNRPVKSK